jgi:sugar phosphate isomerase/epimerase
MATAMTPKTPLRLANCLVGVQAMALKDHLRADFSGTLQCLSAMGYREIELCSFKGFAGDALRGDFGHLADVPASEIRRWIDNSGMIVRSCQFKPFEFDDTHIDATLKFSASLELHYLVLMDVYFNTPDWQPSFAMLNAYSQRVKREGFQLALHTGNDFWIERDGKTPFAAMLPSVPAENCVIQLDLSAALLCGVDAGQCLALNPGRFFSVHLRDGKKPAVPVRYLPALPLGQGDIDLKSVIAGARSADLKSYIVEMVVLPPLDSIDAFKESADFIRNMDS